MSSGEEPQGTIPLPKSKKRRTPRACDFCRKRKIRCDSEEMPDNRCSNCIEFGNDCTHEEVAKKRTSVKGYISHLEDRLATMTTLLRTLRPEGELKPDTNKTSDNTGTARIPPIQSLTDTSSTPPSVEDIELAALAAKMNKLPFCATKNRFFGEASTMAFLQAAFEQKEQVGGWRKGPQFMPRLMHRPDHWNMHPWEVPCRKPEPPKYEFPDPDLAASLVSFYFSEYNMFLPLLHRPTFERAIAQDLHHKDHMFGATVLLVCALGAHYSNDPRVFLEGTNSHSAGWKWYSQVHLLEKKCFLQAPSLYELQAYCLLVLWLQLSSTPQLLWPMIGMGIRLAQDVGAHRRKPYSQRWTVEDELKKRAFWILLCHDRACSTFIGRPRAMQDEDFDLDLPIECDDEYWENEDPELAFKQPAGKPSTVAYFNSFLQLGQVVGYVLRTIYSIKKSKIMLGIVGPNWEHQIIAELDSSLNKWVDSVPDHLRWDPHREPCLFFHQSAALYTYYYYVQILIHRPFISTPSKPSSLRYPSLAICTNAARSCCHVASIQNRHKLSAQPHLQMSVFAAGIVLLLKIWGGRQSGLYTDTNKEMADVHKCMNVLKSLEDRWHPAGRFGDILHELACVGDLPLPQASPVIRTKRGRDDDSATSSPSTAPSSTSVSSPEPCDTEGKWEVPSNKSFPPFSFNVSDGQIASQTGALPMYTDELGRLPLDAPFKFAGNNQGPAVGPSDFLASLPANNGPMSIDGIFDISNSLTSDFATNDFSPMTDPGNVNPIQPIQEHGSTQTMTEGWDLEYLQLPSDQTMDESKIPMWSYAPTTFGFGDWGMYLSAVSGHTTYSTNDGL